MFISKLSSMLESYDKYGEHRLNGLKVVYVLLILYAGNLFFYIPNPYFYYFYVPITVMSAEVVGNTIKEKYFLFLYCLVSSAITIFVFNLFAPYWFLFICVFLYSVLLYFSTIDNRQQVLVVVPISLALGAYSLLYEEINTNFYLILNNCATIILSMCIALGALACFPRGYYYRLWLRALSLLTTQIIEHLFQILDNQRPESDPVQGHVVQIVRYANMLPRSLPIYSILKINSLVNKLLLIVVLAEKNAMVIDDTIIKKLISELSALKAAIEQEQPCEIKSASLEVLDKIIGSWNHLCLNH
jgi:hypothetical protein